jgi:hypothetical protein
MLCFDEFFTARPKPSVVNTVLLLDGENFLTFPLLQGKETVLQLLLHVQKRDLIILMTQQNKSAI